jgi:hypothetical protein
MDRLDKLEIEIAKLDGFTRGLAESLRHTVEKLERVDNEVHEKSCQTEWIILEERLPPQDLYVLICTYDYRKGVEMENVEIASRLGNQWVDAQDGELINMKNQIVTHWMPIPDCPGVKI